MKQDAEDYLGHPVEKRSSRCRLLNDAQRQATKTRKIAGWTWCGSSTMPDGVRTGLRPGQEEEEGSGLRPGGGTYDISILELAEGVFEVKSTNGDTHLV